MFNKKKLAELVKSRDTWKELAMMKDLRSSNLQLEMVREILRKNKQIHCLNHAIVRYKNQIKKLRSKGNEEKAREH